MYVQEIVFVFLLYCLKETVSPDFLDNNFFGSNCSYIVARVHLIFRVIFNNRVADPVHFWPDPDPANQNFQNRIRIRIWFPIQILLALTKNQFKHLILFTSIRFLLIFEWWFFLPEKWKNPPENKALFFNYFFLVYSILHIQSTDRIRIRVRIRLKFSGSDQKGPTLFKKHVYSALCDTVRDIIFLVSYLFHEIN